MSINRKNQLNSVRGQVKLRQSNGSTDGSGIPDQYADGKAAKVWSLYIGDKNSRTQHYKQFVTGLLRQHDCYNVLDVAAGTGIDSIMLLESGFQVTSVDASDKMLKYAIKERWLRRKEQAFDRWVIEEANWLTLPDDLVKPGSGFDAIICLGNSFPHLTDLRGDGMTIPLAIKNFYDMLKPGGFLMIDHRNFDYMLDHGQAPAKNIYYTSKYIKDVKTSLLLVNNKPSLITLNYFMDTSDVETQFDEATDTEHTKRGRYSGDLANHFVLSYYPHRLKEFTKLLDDIFKSSNHQIYGDFKPLDKSNRDPAFYIHFIKKEL